MRIKRKNNGNRTGTKLLLGFFVLIGISTNLGAQGEYALLFLRIQPSARLNGMAGAFSGLPSNDVFGHYYNPAQMGFFGRPKNLALQFMHSDYLPQFDFDDLYFNSYGLSFGYNFAETPTVFPKRLGIGFLKGYLSIGENVWTDQQVINWGPTKVKSGMTL